LADTKTKLLAGHSHGPLIDRDSGGGASIEGTAECKSSEEKSECPPATMESTASEAGRRTVCGGARLVGRETGEM
jgi:hypothetical protein